jgi:hypothetical protein
MRSKPSSRSVTLPDAAGPDPYYAGGEVVAQTSDGVVLSTPARTQAVRIPPETIVWKEVTGGPELIGMSDWLDVRGVPQVDGSLLATSGMVFVNIARREGVIQTISAHDLTVRDDRGLHSLEFSHVLEVIDSKDESQLAGGLSALTPGTYIGAVGLRLAEGGFRATRIWI